MCDAGKSKKRCQQESPGANISNVRRKDSMPSLAISGTISKAATGSAHHRPNAAFKIKPASKIAESQAQNSDCLASATWRRSRVHEQYAVLLLQAMASRSGIRRPKQCRDAALRWLAKQQVASGLVDYVRNESPYAPGAPAKHARHWQAGSWCEHTLVEHWQGRKTGLVSSLQGLRPIVYFE